MIVSQSDLELILNPRIRQRTFQLPVRYGKWGERKRCPARKGGVYTLRASVPYERYRREAALKGSQRAGALWLIDRCVEPTLSVLVTVAAEPKVVDGSWLVRFTKGDHGELYDRPRLLAANPGGVEGDYTTAASMAVPGSAEEIPEANQGEYAKAAENARRSGLCDQRQRLLELVSMVRLEVARQNIGTSTARKRLKTVEHNLRALEREARRVA